jgi:hypothetical protein
MKLFFKSQSRNDWRGAFGKNLREILSPFAKGKWLEPFGVTRLHVSESTDFQVTVQALRGKHGALINIEMSFFHDGDRAVGHLSDITVDDRFHQRHIGTEALARSLNVFLGTDVKKVTLWSVADVDVWYRCGVIPLYWPTKDGPALEVDESYNNWVAIFEKDLASILANSARRPGWTKEDTQWLRNLRTQAKAFGICEISTRDDLFVITKGKVQRLGKAVFQCAAEGVIDFGNKWTRARLKNYAGLDVENRMLCQRPLSTPRQNSRLLLKQRPA